MDWMFERVLSVGMMCEDQPELFIEAVESIEMIANMKLEKKGYAYLDMGTVFYGASFSPLSIAVTEKARECFVECGCRQGEAKAYLNIGVVHLDTRNPDEALSCMQTALSIFRIIGDKEGECACYNSLSAIHNSLGEAEKASDFVKLSSEMKNEHGIRWIERDDPTLREHMWIARVYRILTNRI